MQYATLTTLASHAVINLLCISRARLLLRASAVQRRHAIRIKLLGVIQLGSEAAQLIQHSFQVGLGISPNVALTVYLMWVWRFPPVKLLPLCQ